MKKSETIGFISIGLGVASGCFVGYLGFSFGICVIAGLIMAASFFGAILNQQAKISVVDSKTINKG